MSYLSLGTTVEARILRTLAESRGDAARITLAEILEAQARSSSNATAQRPPCATNQAPVEASVENRQNYWE